MGTNTYIINPATDAKNHFYGMTKLVHGGHFEVWQWAYTPGEWEDMMGELVAVSDDDAIYRRLANYEHAFYAWGNAQGQLYARRSCWMIPVDPSKPTRAANIRASFLSDPGGITLRLWWADPPWPYAGNSNPWGTGKQLAASIVCPAQLTYAVVSLQGARTHLVPHNYGADGLWPYLSLNNYACLMVEAYGWQEWTMRFVGAEAFLISPTIEVNPDGAGRTITPLTPGPAQARGGKPGAGHRTRL